MQRVSKLFLYTVIAPTSLTDGTALRLRRREGISGEKAHLQMARVGVYWHKHQNTSAVSSGTQTTDCDWPDCSQELKPRSLQYN